MFRLFSFLLLLLPLSSFASSVSLGSHEVDSVVVDTLYISDTVIVVDTVLVWGVKKRVEQSDTIFLASDSDSWSVVEEDSLKHDDFFIRKDSGLFLVSAKIGFSDSNTGTDRSGYSLGTTPPMALQVEYFHNDFFSYGGQIVYTRNKFVNDTLTSQYEKEGTMGLAAIGTFHYGDWLQDITHNNLHFGYLDLYVSLAVRMDMHRSVVAEPWDENVQQFISGEKKKEAYVKMRLRPIFGARYYISDRFSINIELGKGNLGILTSSVSWLISKP